MVDVINITKKFGDFTALSGLSFHVGKGSMYGLVGYNGAGKTTLLKTIAGVYKPEAGEVKILGENIFDNAKMKQKLFYVPDDLYFQPYASMEKMAKFYKGYYPKFSDTTFNKLTDLFGLDKTKRLNSFSKGMQRQAEMVLGMATLPEVLLLDESFDGLDPAKRNMAKKLLTEYVKEKECTVIISSHNLHELGDICDHIGLINGQKIVLDRAVDEISGSRSKFRVVFDRDIEQTDFDGIELKNFEKDGRIITLTAQGESAALEEKLQSMNPVLLENFPLSLEEIFLEEMEGTGYDLTKIFD
ncbi:MAG TPA: ABC transporter ATP-binding protein [Clostridia bacterium]|nr:ABC transporter ATP-binding protein [Clostridia bacterium]